MPVAAQDRFQLGDHVDGVILRAKHRVWQPAQPTRFGTLSCWRPSSHVIDFELQFRNCVPQHSFMLNLGLAFGEDHMSIPTADELGFIRKWHAILMGMVDPVLDCQGIMRVSCR